MLARIPASSSSSFPTAICRGHQEKTVFTNWLPICMIIATVREQIHRDKSNQISLPNVRFAVKTASVTLPSITGAINAPPKQVVMWDIENGSKRCHQFTVRSIRMNELRLEKVGSDNIRP